MSNLKKQTANGLAWNLLGTSATQGITFLVTIVLARLLDPADFGLVGISLAFIALIHLFVEAGMTKALIQRKEIDPQLYDSVFLFTLGGGTVVALLLQFTASSIAAYFATPQLTAVLRILAWEIPLAALMIIHTVELKRAMRFKELSLRLFVANSLSGFIGVGMALAGWGVFALVAQKLTGSMLSVALLWWLSDWRPRRRFSRRDLSSISGYSRYVFFSNLLGQAVKQLDSLVIGKLFMPATLGFFSRSESLNRLVNKYASGGIRQVTFPAMSRLQDDPMRFRRAYLKLIEVTALLSFGLAGGLLFSGEAIILLLFGEKWTPSVFIFQVLTLRSFNYPINAVIVNAFLAGGFARENFRHGLVRAALSSLPFIVAYFLGFKAFLYAILLVSFVGTFYNNFVLSRLIDLPLIDQLKRIYRYGAYFLLAATPAYLLTLQIDYFLIAGLASTATFGLIYLSLLLVFQRALLLSFIEFLPPKLTALLPLKISHG